MLAMFNRIPVWQLKDLFLQLNAQLPTSSSAAVERLFSTTSLVMSHKCTRLSDRNFENLMYVKANQWFAWWTVVEQNVMDSERTWLLRISTYLHHDFVSLLTLFRKFNTRRNAELLFKPCIWTFAVRLESPSKVLTIAILYEKADFRSGGKWIVEIVLLLNLA